MLVYFGKHPGWFGPYQLADVIAAVFRLTDARTRALAEWLDGERNWVGNLLKWYHERWDRRTTIVRVHGYDAWSADHTLAMVILPVLQRLRTDGDCFGLIDLEDGPEHLRGIKNAETGWDDKASERWGWALEEMIWAFGEIVRDDGLMQFYGDGKRDTDGYVKYQARVNNGTLLFGKYFQALWH